MYICVYMRIYIYIYIYICIYTRIYMQIDAITGGHYAEKRSRHEEPVRDPIRPRTHL